MCLWPDRTTSEPSNPEIPPAPNPVKPPPSKETLLKRLLRSIIDVIKQTTVDVIKQTTVKAALTVLTPIVVATLALFLPVEPPITDTKNTGVIVDAKNPGEIIENKNGNVKQPPPGISKQPELPKEQEPPKEQAKENDPPGGVKPTQPHSPETMIVPQPESYDAHNTPSQPQPKECKEKYDLAKKEFLSGNYSEGISICKIGLSIPVCRNDKGLLGLFDDLHAFDSTLPKSNKSKESTAQREPLK